MVECDDRERERDEIIVCEITCGQMSCRGRERGVDVVSVGGGGSCAASTAAAAAAVAAAAAAAAYVEYENNNSELEILSVFVPMRKCALLLRSGAQLQAPRRRRQRTAEQTSAPTPLCGCKRSSQNKRFGAAGRRSAAAASSQPPADRSENP